MESDGKIMIKRRTKNLTKSQNEVLTAVFLSTSAEELPDSCPQPSRGFEGL